ncbi:CHASE2 domain-containing protein [Desulfonema magnum]|uniref:CHASE 2 domain-containing protein n=1 Tax=Desulfonema magnum TaxID=45655 RepID=A0A975BPT7_9BACT|nr:CHASE2 domain-containing protein [Desulfonema magnum]QTA89375.1 CHASE 2 domain-containing protein [Desulfonema magnum]
MKKILQINWTDRKRRFILNIFWGIVVSVLINFVAPHTDMGHTVLNELYDYLVIKDFRQAAEKGDFPISDRIRMVTFDRDTYRASHTRGLWTPRDLAGESILKSLELGARGVVADIALNIPAPVFRKSDKKDENEEFLELLKDAAEYARYESNGAVIILARGDRDTRMNDEEKKYCDDFDKLIDTYKDVIKTGSPGAFEHVSDYQTRLFRFYERTKQNEIFFSIQILAVTYLLTSRDEGNQLIKDKKKEILKGNENITMNIPGRKTIQILDQTDLSREYLSARYIFRVAPRAVLSDHGIEDDPFIKYPQLKLSPEALLDEEGKPYRDKVVLIGSENPEIGDIHLTPPGRMNGIFLVANGINLFLEGLQIHELSVGIKILVEVVCILVSAVFFVWCHPTVAFFILAGIFWLINSSYSLVLFSRYGLFVDVWFPIIGIGVSRIIADTDNLVLKWVFKSPA